jgi:PAS domain S-box-containing protein
MSQAAGNDNEYNTSADMGADTNQSVLLDGVWTAPAAHAPEDSTLVQLLRPMLLPLSASAATVYLKTDADSKALHLHVGVTSEKGEACVVPTFLSLDQPEVQRLLAADGPVSAGCAKLNEASDLFAAGEQSEWHCCPIQVNNEACGLLMLAGQAQQPSLAQWMPAICCQVGAIIEQTEHSHQAHTASTRLKREVTLWDALNRAALEISSQRDPGEIFNIITSRLAALGLLAAISVPVEAAAPDTSSMEYQVVSVALPDSDLLRELAEMLKTGTLIGTTFRPAMDGLEQERLEKGEERFIRWDVAYLIGKLTPLHAAMLRKAASRLGLNSIVVVPLKKRDEVGALLFILGSDLTSADGPSIAAFAQHASVAIENARLQHQLQANARELHADVAARTAEVYKERKRLQAVLESAGSGIVITGPDGVIEYANPAWERLTGRSAAEEIRRRVRIVDEDDFPPLFSGRYASREVTARRPDDTMYTAKVTVTPLFERECEGQKLDGLVVVYRDITEYKAIDRLKSQFLNTASHQLRTPLTTILGFSELLVSRPNLTGEERARFLQHINEHAQRLKDLVEDLFDISQAEVGEEIELDRHPLQLEPLLQQEMRWWRQHYPEHNFELVIAEHCPAVIGDRDRIIRQVMHNLLSNAAKYSSAGSTVTVTLTPAGRYLEIAIADQGIGMTEEEQRQAFDKFWRADASSTAIDGTGLGLVIARHIVELHRGQIWMESTPGTGTVVTFTLPTAGHKPTVLVVEDEEHVLEVEDNILRDNRLQTILANNGTDAIRLARQHRPDVILLDLMMPRVSGLEVLKTLKEDPATSSIPVLIVSAKTSWQSIEETYKLGAVDFVAKPFEYDELLSRVNRVLETSKRQPAITDTG